MADSTHHAPMDSAKNSLLLLYDIASKAMGSSEAELHSVQLSPDLEDYSPHQDIAHSNIESPLSAASKAVGREKKAKRKLDITSEGILINSSSGLCVKNSTNNKVLSCNQLRQSCPEIFVLCNRLKSYRKMLGKKEAKDSDSETLAAKKGNCDLPGRPASIASAMPNNWIENTLRCLSAVFCCHSCNGSAIIREVIDSGCIVKLFPFQELVKDNGNFPFVGNYRGISQTCSGVNVIKNSITNLYTKEITKADFQSVSSFSINLERDTLLFMRQLNAITSRFVWRSNGFTQLGYELELEVYGLLRCSFSSAGLIKYFAVYFDPSCVVRHSLCRDKELRRVKGSAFEPI